MPAADTVDRIILQRLSDADLPETAKDLILTAMLGEADLAAFLGGSAPAPQHPEPSAGTGNREAIGTYLAGVEVTGFRGIGQTALLSLVPGPGLTIVTGRNGSGKSSFAEAAEFALTGSNKRWAGRTGVWQQGWRNLHSGVDPHIRVRLGIEGQRHGGTVECRWEGGGGLDDHATFLQIAGQPRRPVTDLGWDTPLQLYRPFLSYAELGGLLTGRPSEMHDSLQRILGLGRLVEIEQLLKTARKNTDERRKLPAALLPELRAALAAHPDPRARTAERLLATRVADLEQLSALTVADDAVGATSTVPLRQLDVLELPDRGDLAAEVARLRAALDRISDLAGTDVAQARAVASLLRGALDHQHAHPDQPCPVCGGRILDQAWADDARQQIQALTEQAQQLEQAHRAERDAVRALREKVPGTPAVLLADLATDGVDTADARAAWRAWDDLMSAGAPARIAERALDTFNALGTALAPAQAAARAALQRRQQAWQPAADHIRTWIDAERDGRLAATMLADLKKAITWLLANGNEIRNEQLAPVASQATEIWNTLRQESNIDLGAIRLAGTGPSRRVDLDVAIDGVRGAALSVMSQGELHSLALALFLPRATMPESPFRFLVIDDPVQSMDPAKVYGLAQVLATAAQRRQVIVFTHDDRLPAAVRHLQINARILTVSRLAHSQVLVTGDRHGDPALRYLDDAWAIAHDDDMEPDLRTPIVCNLIRDAIEFTCHELIRARGFRTGTTIADTEATISEAHGLRPVLALALLSDARRTGELPDTLRRLDVVAPRVVAAANSGAHSARQTPLDALVDDARRLVRKLSQP